MITANAHEVFEGHLLAIQDEAKRMLVINVLDTAFLVKKWFDAYAPTATPADIVAMTAIIMQRESGGGIVKALRGVEDSLEAIVSSVDSVASNMPPAAD
jgi:hypothetical protein